MVMGVMLWAAQSCTIPKGMVDGDKQQPTIDGSMVAQNDDPTRQAEEEDLVGRVVFFFAFEADAGAAVEEVDAMAPGGGVSCGLCCGVCI
jgi:hypothetical protein